MVSSISSTASISQLFAKLDSKSQGYIEKSDLLSAFSQINSSSSDSSEIDDLFAALDSDSDGKVTESEFSTTLTKLQEELDSQLNEMRMNGFGGNQGSSGMASMPPPPPPQDDSGFTKEELTSQLDEIGSTDSERTSFISNIVSNFEQQRQDFLDLVNSERFKEQFFPDYLLLNTRRQELQANVDESRLRQQRFQAWRVEAEAIDAEFKRLN